MPTLTRSARRQLLADGMLRAHGIAPEVKVKMIRITTRDTIREDAIDRIESHYVRGRIDSVSDDGAGRMTFSVIPSQHATPAERRAINRRLSGTGWHYRWTRDIPIACHA